MSCDTDDDYDYELYGLESYEEMEGPPLIKKRSRLIAAVVQNQVDVLKDLLDSPKWYNVCDKWGYSLLQIAILRNNKEVFDYMVSLPDFPLEFINHYGQTAFILSLEGYVSNDIYMDEHFAYELIKKGTCINRMCDHKETPLHCALQRSYTKVAKLLIESGLDVNVRNGDGETPLDLAFLFLKEPRCEIISALLVYGAIPTLDLFETSVLDKMDHGLQENLFLCACDQHTKLKLSVDVLLALIEAKSDLIDEIIKYPVKIKPNDGSFFGTLCTMSVDGLKLTLEKFNACVRQAFSLSDITQNFKENVCDNNISLENLNLMLESNLKSHVIHYILKVDSRIKPGVLNSGFLYSESELTELYCYLLSHGLTTINSRDLDFIYELHGPCELFKFLLYMDVQLEPEEYFPSNIMTVFFSDVTMNLDKFLQYPRYNSINSVVKYFAHPKLKEIYQRECLDDKKKDLPELPTLVELARNSFREYFIKRFKITNCKQFYYLMDCLLISPVHKKIITYETELY